MDIPIIKQTPDSDMVGPNPTFHKSKFDNLVYDKGVNVYHDKMIKCPCGTGGKANPALPSCHNCGGSGYVLIQRIQTKMVVQGINYETKFKEWSLELLGTIKITCLSKDALSHMDRIILLDSETISNELITIKEYKGVLYSYVTYDIDSIELFYSFQGDDVKLISMVQGEDYTIDGFKIIFDTVKFKRYNTKYGFSIKYRHKPQFHILDIPRDIMTAPDNENGGETMNDFPLNAIGRRSHFVIDALNFEGDYLLSNILPSKQEEKCSQ